MQLEATGFSLTDNLPPRLDALDQHFVAADLAAKRRHARRNSDAMAHQTRDELFSNWDKLADDWDVLRT